MQRLMSNPDVQNVGESIRAGALKVGAFLFTLLFFSFIVLYMLSRPSFSIPLFLFRPLPIVHPHPFSIYPPLSYLSSSALNTDTETNHIL